MLFLPTPTSNDALAVSLAHCSVYFRPIGVDEQPNFFAMFRPGYNSPSLTFSHLPQIAFDAP